MGGIGGIFPSAGLCDSPLQGGGEAGQGKLQLGFALGLEVILQQLFIILQSLGRVCALPHTEKCSHCGPRFPVCLRPLCPGFSAQIYPRNLQK